MNFLIPFSTIAEISGDICVLPFVIDHLEHTREGERENTREGKRVHTRAGKRVHNAREGKKREHGREGNRE